ncbi:Disease resistance protein RPS6 [Cardamine amara subsp. amara]|uniref:ADP-ribosyl cyclase/cyclic ADP-ribose hydrolase n=1 Tax=Cardamine amara subsp. amara TaxID=228776 RepID=A0ABD1C5C2_CARAN
MSSSSSSRNWRYDVFPSFRGEDVRQSFLSHFLKELDRKLISAFKDNKIEKGQTLDPVLKQAIKDSRIAIVIFSENYASSAWCLNELLEILKCKDEFNQLVIPIFYNIDPSHVRKQSGDFGKIFTKTCLSHNKTEAEIGLWRKALTNVANIVGSHPQKWENEAKLIEDIINDILVKLSLTPSKDFDDYVGIEAHIARMSSLLHLESKEVRMVGIWGSSGIGKTTIARALFSRLSRLFQGRIFIDRAFISKIKVDYRGANTDDYNMRLSLQGNFLSEILGTRNIKVDHLGAVGDRLKNQKVLIVIDDLDEKVVLEALVGQTQWFGCGSRIIVITKDRHLLTGHGIHHIYEVPLPSGKLALEMFCQYAFKQNSPPKDFENLAVEVVRHAGSLPLGLNVLGSSLWGRDNKYWIEMMPGLRNGLDGKIEKTLRFSYDGIDSEEDQAIFRHIACLFKFLNRIHIDDVKLLLAVRDWSVCNGLQRLTEKSLIHLKYDCVEMHCLLQEMGRKIVRDYSIDEPGKQEFLFDSKDICDVLTENTGTKKVLGILLNIDEIDDYDELCVHESAFKKMPNLRFLKVVTSKNEVRLQLDKSFDYLPPSLKLLSCNFYPMRCLPSKFRSINLVILEMRHSKLEKLWEGDLSLPCLKEMNLGGSEDLKEIPDLSRATNLETLYLYGCSSLVELPSSIGNLNKLSWLYMPGCKNLEILPSGIINLQSLDRLYLIGCSKLKSFPDISRNVSQLNLSGTAIEEIPWWVGNFKRLKILDMESCSMLKYASKGEWQWKQTKSPLNYQVANPWSVSLPYYFAPQVDFRKCINLDLEALLQQQSVFGQVMLSGEEMPLYFTHKAKGTSSSLTIPLLPISTYPFIRLRVCAVIFSRSLGAGDIKLNCQFKDRLGNHSDCSAYQESLITFEEGGNLYVFDTCFYPEKEDIAKLNFDHVDLQLHFTPICGDSASCYLKEWGIRVLEDNSSAEKQLGDPNTLSHVSEADEDNMVNEINHSQELGTRNTVLSLGLSSSSTFEDFGDDVNKRKRNSETEEEHGRTSKRIKTFLELEDAESSNHSKSILISKPESSKRRRLSIENNEEKSCFFLPGLNMTSNEEDETLYGTTVQAKEAETRPDNS